MPYTTRADGDVITASSHNANCRDQVVSTVTSGTRPSGTEGQVIYETDTDLYKAYIGGWTDWGALGAWQTYTPTLTQSATVTKTVTYARYNRIGRMVTVQVYLSVTGAGTANNAVIIGTPFPAVIAGSLAVGSGWIFDTSAATTLYPGIVNLDSTTGFKLFDATQAVAVTTQLGQTGTAFSAALASGDIVSLTATFEAAS